MPRGLDKELSHWHCDSYLGSHFPLLSLCTLWLIPHHLQTSISFLLLYLWNLWVMYSFCFHIFSSHPFIVHLSDVNTQNHCPTHPPQHTLFRTLLRSDLAYGYSPKRKLKTTQRIGRWLQWSCVLPNTTEQLQVGIHSGWDNMHKNCARPSQKKVPAWRREAWSPTPSPGAVSS